MQGTSHFTEDNAPMSRAARKQSPIQKKNKRARRRSDGQNGGWFSCWLRPQQDGVAEKPFSEQLKSKEWIKNLINSLTKFVKLQAGFNEIIKYIKDK